MRRTAEEAAQTRQSILDAALKVFSQKGYHAATLTNVAEAAQVTRGAIYHHFDNKAKLYEALLNEASAIGSDTVQQAMTEGSSFVEICALILEKSLAVVETNLQMRQIMALSLFKTGFDPELVELDEARQQEAVTIVETIAQLMQAGIASGELRPNLDPHDAARAFIAYQNGLIKLWLTNQQAFSIGGRAPQFAQIFLNGIVA